MWSFKKFFNKPDLLTDYLMPAITAFGNDAGINVFYVSKLKQVVFIRGKRKFFIDKEEIENAYYFESRTSFIELLKKSIQEVHPLVFSGFTNFITTA